MLLGCLGPMYNNWDVMPYTFGVGIRIFIVVWIIFVPIVITARLEKIIKLLEELNKK